jgi:hypothetical protein
MILSMHATPFNSLTADTVPHIYSPALRSSHTKRTRHVGDFTDWKSHDSYRKAFDRLLRDLRAGA